MLEKEILENPLIKNIVEGIQEVKGKDITIIDLRKIENTVTQFFIICTGNTNTQVSALSSSIEDTVRENIKDKPWHIEGLENSQWVLMDYISAVVHIFQPEFREFYDIESLWGDVESITLPNLD